MYPRACLRTLTGLLLTALAASCEDNDDDELRDYTPPAGLGTLVVDNNTITDIEVYVDGQALPRVNDGKYRRYDLKPGLHRLVLSDDEDNVRAYSSDLDILQGRQTILDVSTDFGLSRPRFDVDTFLD